MQQAAEKSPAKRITVVAVFIAAIIVFILFSQNRSGFKTADSDDLTLLREAYSAILENYVETPDSKKLVLKMVDGMLAALDPHSAYLPPEPYHEMEVQISGSFGGVGIELGTKEGRLTVISPIDDTPAFRAGIKANDHIAKIDGTSTSGMNISKAVKMMRGEKGKPVTLTMLRAESRKPLTFTIIRDIIKLKSLKAKLLESGYGFIRISQFQERTGGDFKDALKELHKQSGGRMKGLIIDLRYNPGGLINSCVEVANCFVGEDINKTVIVSIKGRTPESNRIYNGSLGTKEPHYPIIVLINGGSASASEILAGALQDHKRAIIMGTQSFGKGSVQSIFPMKDNAALKLTTALYYTPSGRSIQAKGIVPDIEVPNIMPLLPKEKGKEMHEKDLDKSLAPEGVEGVVKPVEIAPKKPVDAKAKESDLQKDYQLSRAVELLQSLEILKANGFQ
ncbi:MAG: S41 family peptidase [Desulfuromonadaceae bacterium]|nr:S41 family peptidase [Desulfuromonadaceae bacterium]MDD2855427.1 S41 family peptidase [Desulfuromonadaceae bacterium]